MVFIEARKHEVLAQHAERSSRACGRPPLLRQPGLSSPVLAWGAMGPSARVSAGLVSTSSLWGLRGGRRGIRLWALAGGGEGGIQTSSI